MKTLWTGALAFGLVNIPIKLYSGTQAHNFDLDMLHKKDLSPIRYAKVCAEEEAEVTSEEIVKGYEYSEGDYVVLEDEDFEKAKAESSDTIDIFGFIDASGVDPDYFEKPFYLEPDKGGTQAYVLLYEALTRSNKVGIARYVLRNREHLAVVRPALHNNQVMLVLNRIRFADEIRQPDNLNLPDTAQLHEVSEREVEMALALVDQLTGPFRPEEYQDTYKQELERIIGEKLAGKEPAPARREKPVPANITDLMELLKASLQEQQKGGETRRRRRAS